MRGQFQKLDPKRRFPYPADDRLGNIDGSGLLGPNLQVKSRVNCQGNTTPNPTTPERQVLDDPLLALQGSIGKHSGKIYWISLVFALFHALRIAINKMGTL